MPSFFSGDFLVSMLGALLSIAKTAIFVVPPIVILGTYIIFKRKFKYRVLIITPTQSGEKWRYTIGGFMGNRFRIWKPKLFPVSVDTSWAMLTERGKQLLIFRNTDEKTVAQVKLAFYGPDNSTLGFKAQDFARSYWADKWALSQKSKITLTGFLNQYGNHVMIAMIIVFSIVQTSLTFG